MMPRNSAKYDIRARVLRPGSRSKLSIKTQFVAAPPGGLNINIVFTARALRGTKPRVKTDLITIRILSAQPRAEQTERA